MRFFSYTIVSDTGFAPNINKNGKYLTLACCKPGIRRKANKGDWVIACSSSKGGRESKLVYAMEVKEKLTFEEYDKDKRFQYKKPDNDADGDNIYFKNKTGNWEQRTNKHHEKKNMKKDLRGENVLISDHFFYFGKKSIPLRKFRELIYNKQNYKTKFSETKVKEFIKWIEHEFESGVHSEPTMRISRSCSGC